MENVFSSTMNFSGPNLEVPDEYSFQDAKEEKQIVLYERGKTEQELKESKDIDTGRII